MNNTNNTEPFEAADKYGDTWRRNDAGRYYPRVHRSGTEFGIAQDRGKANPTYADIANDYGPMRDLKYNDETPEPGDEVEVRYRAKYRKRFGYESSHDGDHSVDVIHWGGSIPVNYVVPETADITVVSRAKPAVPEEPEKDCLGVFAYPRLFLDMRNAVSNGNEGKPWLDTVAGKFVSWSGVVDAARELESEIEVIQRGEVIG